LARRSQQGCVGDDGAIRKKPANRRWWAWQPKAWKNMTVTESQPAWHRQLEAQEGEVPQGMLARMRLDRHLGRLPQRAAWAGFVFVSGFLNIGILALVAMVSGSPFVFPSVGPTIFKFFFEPTTPQASPRNAIMGHALGIGCGYLALLLTSLENAPSAMTEGISLTRTFAAALAFALTGALMILFRTVHPPAGATALIVSLGMIHEPFHLAVMELAIVLIAVQAFLVNRLAGVHYPFWGYRSLPLPSRPAGS
jgi:hypothetical protein